MRELSQDEMEIALEDGISGETLTKTGETLGFNSKMAFHRYCLKHPIFAKELSAARLASTDHLEDKMLKLIETCDDPKLMRAQMDVLARVLAFRKPERYGQRIDLNVNQTSDIGAALAQMERRVASAYNAPLLDAVDVTPQKPNTINELL